MTVDHAPAESEPVKAQEVDLEPDADGTIGAPSVNLTPDDGAFAALC